MQVKTGTFKINRTPILTIGKKNLLKNHNISEITAKSTWRDV